MPGGEGTVKSGVARASGIICAHSPLSRVEESKMERQERRRPASLAKYAPVC